MYAGSLRVQYPAPSGGVNPACPRRAAECAVPVQLGAGSTQGAHLRPITAATCFPAQATCPSPGKHTVTPLGTIPLLVAWRWERTRYLRRKVHAPCQVGQNATLSRHALTKCTRAIPPRERQEFRFVARAVDKVRFRSRTPRL